MNYFLIFTFLITILIIYIIYRKTYVHDIHETMVGSLVYPNYVPNVPMDYYQTIIPFDKNVQCKLPQTRRYLGWPCWWTKNATNYCVPEQKLNKPFKNYLNNTPLYYDGIWQNINNQRWKLIPKSPNVCKQVNKIPCGNKNIDCNLPGYNPLPSETKELVPILDEPSCKLIPKSVSINNFTLPKKNKWTGRFNAPLDNNRTCAPPRPFPYGTCFSSNNPPAPPSYYL